MRTMSSHFNLRGEIMLKQLQRAYTIDEQIQNLRQLHNMHSIYPHVDWKTMDFPENWQEVLLPLQ